MGVGVRVGVEVFVGVRVEDGDSVTVGDGVRLGIVGVGEGVQELLATGGGPVRPTV